MGICLDSYLDLCLLFVVHFLVVSCDEVSIPVFLLSISELHLNSNCFVLRNSSISFCCSSQVKQIRHLLGFVMAGLMTVGQVCTFIVYAEDFCQDYNCSFSRGSGTSVAAIVCYIVAGLGFFFTKDYPGEEGLEKLKERKTQQSEAESVEEDYEDDDDEEKYYDESQSEENQGFSV